jgi:hypothetical protein
LDQEGFRPELLLLIDPEVPGSTKMLAADEQLKRFWETFRNEGSTYLMRKARTRQAVTLSICGTGSADHHPPSGSPRCTYASTGPLRLQDLPREHHADSRHSPR